MSITFHKNKNIKRHEINDKSNGRLLSENATAEHAEQIIRAAGQLHRDVQINQNSDSDDGV